MSTDNQSCLRFSLEESVWFQRGQEVAELISISLDPNITIQENDQYVTIKGSLELSGEYKCAEEQEGEELEPQLAARQVHSVSEREEGQREFLHQFPVDITIPQNRIESIYDIDISVESFDYDTPSRNSLKLSAELAITGLYGEQQHGNEEEAIDEEALSEEASIPVEEVNASFFSQPEMESPLRTPETVEGEQESVLGEQVEVEVPKFKEFATPPRAEPPIQEANEDEIDLYKPFSAEAKKEPQASVESVEKAEVEPVLSRNTGEPSGEESKKERVTFWAEEPERKETPPTQAMEDSHATESPVEEAKPIELEPLPVETEAVLDEMDEEVTLEGPIINEKAQQEVEEYESSSSSSSEEKPKKKLSKKKGLSIAEFLARKEDTEVTTLRVCIVQQDDNLQEIAERYEVSVQQLINLNHLGLDQDVSEGQVLYVPVGYAEKR